MRKKKKKKIKLTMHPRLTTTRIRKRKNQKMKQKLHSVMRIGRITSSPAQLTCVTLTRNGSLSRKILEVLKFQHILMVMMLAPKWRSITLKPYTSTTCCGGRKSMMPPLSHLTTTLRRRSSAGHAPDPSSHAGGLKRPPVARECLAEPPHQPVARLPLHTHQDQEG